MPQPPTRTVEQRMVALREANRVRRLRARLKAEVREGTRRPETVVAHPDCATMEVATLLRAVRGVGPVKAATWMRRTGVSASKTLAGLSDRQRRELLALLASRG